MAQNVQHAQRCKGGEGIAQTQGVEGLRAKRVSEQQTS